MVQSLVYQSLEVEAEMLVSDHRNVLECTDYPAHCHGATEPRLIIWFLRRFFFLHRIFLEVHGREYEARCLRLFHCHLHAPNKVIIVLLIECKDAALDGFAADYSLNEITRSVLLLHSTQ